MEWDFDVEWERDLEWELDADWECDVEWACDVELEREELDGPIGNDIISLEFFPDVFFPLVFGFCSDGLVIGSVFGAAAGTDDDGLSFLSVL